MYSQTTRLMDAGRSIQAAVVRADLFIVRAGGALLAALRAVSVAALIVLPIGLIAITTKKRRRQR